VVTKLHHTFAPASKHTESYAILAKLLRQIGASTNLICHCAQLRALSAQRGLKVKLTVQSRLPRVHNSTPQIAIRSASHTLPGRWPGVYALMFWQHVPGSSRQCGHSRRYERVRDSQGTCWVDHRLDRRNCYQGGGNVEPLHQYMTGVSDHGTHQLRNICTMRIASAQRCCCAQDDLVECEAGPDDNLR